MLWRIDWSFIEATTASSSPQTVTGEAHRYLMTCGMRLF